MIETMNANGEKAAKQSTLGFFRKKILIPETKSRKSARNCERKQSNISPFYLNFLCLPSGFSFVILVLIVISVFYVI